MPHSEQVKVGYVTCSDMEEAMERVGHFAYIRRRERASDKLPSPEPDRGCLIVEPVYCTPRKIKQLRFLFSRGGSQEDIAVRFYLDRFLQAESSNVCRPLGDLKRN